MKGIVFTIESAYFLILAFVATAAFLSFMTLVDQPDYDVYAALRVAHDMGEENSSNVPQGFNFSVNCTYGSYAVLDYYEFGNDSNVNKQVCVIK